MKLNDNDLAKHDLEALRECMEIVKRELGLAEQIQSMLDEPRPWAEVAQFACHCVQRAALDLRPRESPPCGPGDKAAQKLPRKMLEAGVSRYDPNPVWAVVGAMQAKKKEQRRSASVRARAVPRPKGGGGTGEKEGAQNQSAQSVRG